MRFLICDTNRSPDIGRQPLAAVGWLLAAASGAQIVQRMGRMGRNRDDSNSRVQILIDARTVQQRQIDGERRGVSERAP